MDLLFLLFITFQPKHRFSSSTISTQMFELRTLSADDWEAWRAVRLAALANSPSAFGSSFIDWSNSPEARWRSRLSIKGAIDLVAYEVNEGDGERAVGMATGVPTGDGMAEIISMWVDPGFRGRGLASSLIRKIASWAVESGFNELRLAVRPDNVAAQSVYQSNSFVVSDEPGDESPSGREIIMLRKLASHYVSRGDVSAIDP
ncbi:acyl-CoA N-acyltransferase [Trichoderma chlorosporum]